MPLYEYKCGKCGSRIEKIQKFSDSPLTTCEACGGELARIISAPAIQFKGTGWYVTDYARKSSSEGGRRSNRSSATESAKSGETSSSSASKSVEPTSSSSK
ncbi:MAG: zinc ribbon domain-containing protein [Acidobacteria bacterium]|nr:zinc ribbon domain-containing protein [Acidobacteriota bacterium]